MPWPGDRDTSLFELLDHELERQNTTLQLIASENFTSPGGPRGHGLGADEQVLRGLPGQALLRRQRVHRRGRGPGARSGEGAVRGRPRERATALGCQRQHGRLPRAARARRQGDGHEPRPRWAPHPRFTREHRAAGSTTSWPTASRRATSDSTTTRSATRPLAERPKMIIAGATAYPAGHRSRTAPRDRRRGRRDPDVRRRAHRGLDRWWRASRARFRSPTSSPSRRTRRCAARAAAACSAEASTRRAIDKAMFPGSAGRAARARHRGQSRRVPRGDGSDVQGLRRSRSSLNAQSLAGALAHQGFRLVSGGTDNHLMLVDLRQFDDELTGKEAQAVLDQAGITLNKNTIPDDPRSPFVTSGVRIGTPAVTTQGMTEPEMAQIADADRARPSRCGPTRPSSPRCARRRHLCSAFTPYPT